MSEQLRLDVTPTMGPFLLHRLMPVLWGASSLLKPWLSICLGDFSLILSGAVMDALRRAGAGGTHNQEATK